MEIVLYAFTAFLYGKLAVMAWRSRRQGAQGALIEAKVLPARVLAIERAWLLIALIVHGILLDATIFPPHAMVFGFAFALSAMLWLGAGAFWIESCFFPIDGLRLLVLPLACVASVLPLVFGGARMLPYAATPLFKLHFLIANIAYGLLALAALHAILMLLIERRLHAIGGVAAHHPRGDSGSWLDALPPLLTLEKLLFRLIGVGFVLLTLTLASGALFSEQLLAHALTFNHKTVFSILSWLMFGALLIGRRLYGWRGRTALRWVLAAFVALLLAYVGSRFVFEVVLHQPII